jgi:putative SOS response-associated peptidase YedK
MVYQGQEYIICKGFDYNTLPVFRPAAVGGGLEKVYMQWGFLPNYIRGQEQVDRFRRGYEDAAGKFHPPYTTLNATSEQLLDKMFKPAALHGRVLVPFSRFYEWRHVQVVGKSGKLLKTPEKFPYRVEMKDKSAPWYLAGVSGSWTDDATGRKKDTFAIVTTEANSLMKQIHNSKERMPTILPARIAMDWLKPDLDEHGILDIANYQIASAEMEATLLEQPFLKADNPHALSADTRPGILDVENPGERGRNSPVDNKGNKP